MVLGIKIHSSSYARPIASSVRCVCQNNNSSYMNNIGKIFMVRLCCTMRLRVGTSSASNSYSSVAWISMQRWAVRVYDHSYNIVITVLSFRTIVERQLMKLPALAITMNLFGSFPPCIGRTKRTKLKTKSFEKIRNSSREKLNARSYWHATRLKRQRWHSSTGLK